VKQGEHTSLHKVITLQVSCKPFLVTDCKCAGPMSAMLVGVWAHREWWRGGWRLLGGYWHCGGASHLQECPGACIEPEGPMRSAM